MAGHRKTGALLVALLSLFLTNSRAQVRFGYSGGLAGEASADIDQELKLGSPDQREGLLKLLGVDGAIAHDAAAAVPNSNIHIEPIVGSEGRLLFFPCTGPGSPSSHLYLLRTTKEHRWHVVAGERFDCWWKPTSYELIKTEGKVDQSVLIHHVNRGHGSGIVEDHMLLFEVRGNLLANVLETKEYTSEDRMAEGPIVQHSSTLLPLPDGSIEETRITTTVGSSTKGGKSETAPVMQSHIALAERRRWRWSAGDKHYVDGSFAPVP
ncbi:hypothetical protein [Granulicella tundricola]|nr:hypothetical protein [Granulicella tundricola]